MPPIHNDVLVSRPSIWERTPPQPRLSPDNQLLRLQQLFYPQNKCRHTHTIKAAPITLRYEPSPNTLRPLFTSRISTTFFRSARSWCALFFLHQRFPFSQDATLRKVMNAASGVSLFLPWRLPDESKIERAICWAKSSAELHARQSWHL